jgi:hypothetical protein
MEYNNVEYWPSFQQDYKNLKQNILFNYNNNIPKTFIRIFDGEYYFLEGKKVGNVGKRHCSKNLKDINIQKFKDGFLANDYVFTQIYADFLPRYHALFPSRPDIKPMEHIYALVANKWLFKKFGSSSSSSSGSGSGSGSSGSGSGGIGLIGGKCKIDIIKKLMGYKEYQEYLGTTEFTDYISVPEKFTCDNVDKLENDLKIQLEQSTSKIFLYGIGISKLAIAHTFKKYKNAIFIDIGCGMSALAGTTSIKRPYFGSWTNFRIKNYNYSEMDPIDYKDTHGMNEVILD